MPPQLDDRKVLPVAIHDAPLDEIEEVFANYGHRERRRMLLGKLKEYVRAVTQTRWPCVVILNGSFVMYCIREPDDLDIILAYGAAVRDEIESPDLPHFKFKVVDRWTCKTLYKVDVKACVLG